MSYTPNDLEKEILSILSRRIKAHWTDIKHEVSDSYKTRYSGSGFDVVLSRSLKRLIDHGLLWKNSIGGSPRPGYWISAKGDVLAWKIDHGLDVFDVSRDMVYAFSYILHRLRNDAIIYAESDNITDYFKEFRTLVNKIDEEAFLRELLVNEMLIDNLDDPLDLSDFTDDEEPYRNNIK
jgi:hypothetical protein